MEIGRAINGTVTPDANPFAAKVEEEKMEEKKEEKEKEEEEKSK